MRASVALSDEDGDKEGVGKAELFGWRPFKTFLRIQISCPSLVNILGSPIDIVLISKAAVNGFFLS